MQPSDDEGGDAEEIAGLVAIRIRAEVADVMPEGERGSAEMKENASAASADDPAGENARGHPDVAQVDIKRGDVVDPGEPGEERGATIERQPRLRAESGGERNAEIAGERDPPGRRVEPARRQKRRSPPARERRARACSAPARARGAAAARAGAARKPARTIPSLQRGSRRRGNEPSDDE